MVENICLSLSFESTVHADGTLTFGSVASGAPFLTCGNEVLTNLLKMTLLHQTALGVSTMELTASPLDSPTPNHHSLYKALE